MRVCLRISASHNVEWVMHEAKNENNFWTEHAHFFLCSWLPSVASDTIVERDQRKICSIDTSTLWIGSPGVILKCRIVVVRTRVRISRSRWLWEYLFRLLLCVSLLLPTSYYYVFCVKYTYMYTSAECPSTMLSRSKNDGIWDLRIVIPIEGWCLTPTMMRIDAWRPRWCGLMRDHIHPEYSVDACEWIRIPAESTGGDCYTGDHGGRSIG